MLDESNCFQWFASVVDAYTARPRSADPLAHAWMVGVDSPTLTQSPTVRSAAWLAQACDTVGVTLPIEAPKVGPG
jgi:hypothetical protein